MTTVLSALAKLVLGISLAIVILMCGGVAAALYFMNKKSTPPPKPIFANDKPTLVAHRSVSKKQAKSKLTSVAKPSEQPSPSETPSSQQLEPGAYRARVTWSDGLSLRSKPDSGAEAVGSLAYNQEIVVLAESDDKNWQRVRLEDSGKEGWVKAGNTQRAEKQQ